MYTNRDRITCAAICYENKKKQTNKQTKETNPKGSAVISRCILLCSRIPIPNRSFSMFDWQLRTHVVILWGVQVASYQVPISRVNITIMRTVRGPYLLIPETPFPSFLQTSRQRKNTITWRWKAQNRQRFGELLFFCSLHCISCCFLFQLFHFTLPHIHLTSYSSVLPTHQINVFI